MDLDCMTKHDDDIIVYIYMEFFLCLVSSLLLVLSCSCSYSCSCSWRPSERKGRFSRLLGWMESYTDWLTELTVKSSLLHFLLSGFFSSVQLCFVFNHKMKGPCVFFMISLLSISFWFAFFIFHVMSSKCRWMDLFFSDFYYSSPSGWCIRDI